ncbi:MAG: HEAT repeat domain-containing protein [Planctomycetales bacterium]|nr:HEAT repeat domain-containing protein [Planctomycetales bacterium]
MVRFAQATRMIRFAPTLAVIAFAVLAASQASAFDWLELPYDSKIMVRDRGFVAGVLAGRDVLDSKEKETRFDNFFKKGLFSEMTQESVLGELPEKRHAFFTRYVRAAKDPAALKRVNDLTLKIVPVLIRGVTRQGKHMDFHPAVQYTAVLILGELDRELGVQFGDKQPPKPLPEALPLLFQLYMANESSDAIRGGALVGIARHAQYSVINDPNGKIGEVLLSQIKQPLPENRDPSAHDWMRRIAVQILGDMGQSGSNPEIVAEIVRLVGDKNTTMALRCAAAETLGKFKLQPAAKVNAVALANGLADLAVDACVYEQRIVAQLEQLPSRRRLAYHLTCVRKSIEPSQKHVEEPQQKMLARIDTFVAQLIEEMDRSSFSDEDLYAKLDTISSQIQAAIGAGGGSGEAPTATPIEDTTEPKADEPTGFDPFGFSPDTALDARGHA